MNGYNVSMSGQRVQHRHTFAINANVKVPDTVGMCAQCVMCVCVERRS
jgi:hypothetical protein